MRKDSHRPQPGYRALALLSCSLLLPACSTLQRTPAPNAAASAQAIPLQWELRGKIGLRGPELNESAYLNWRQCQTHYQLRLSGPLGSAAAILTGQPGSVTLDAGDQHWRAASADELLLQELGWELPLAQLQYWVTGQPAPDQPYHSQAQPGQFEQSGWLIELQQTQQLADRLLPARIKASRGEYSAVVLTKHWNLAPDCSPPDSEH